MSVGDTFCYICQLRNLIGELRLPNETETDKAEEERERPKRGQVANLNSEKDLASNRIDLYTPIFTKSQTGA